MNYDRYDDLDRLLFSLALEEPPADLRASILTATIYRPALVFKAWEVWTLGAIVALIVWLCVLVARGGGEAFMKTVSILGTSAAHVLLAQYTWLWLAAGVGTAFWLLILNLTPMRSPVLERYARR